jgi:hypothetical protein
MFSPRAGLGLASRSAFVVVAAAAAALPMLWSARARAQVHWDVGAQVGAIDRFTTGGDAAGASAQPGPVAQVQGHVALVPMVRLGAYAATDVSPTSDRGTRTFWEAGLHARFTPPLLPAPWRAWAFAGFGYAYTYKTSYHHAETDPNGAGIDVAYGDVYGGVLDVPVGIGVGHKVRGAWELFAELGGRFGVGFFGPMYDDGASGRAVSTSLPFVEPFMGQDSFALSLTAGLSLDE